jgi:hypothetical protein
MTPSSPSRPNCSACCNEAHHCTVLGHSMIRICSDLNPWLRRPPFARKSGELPGSLALLSSLQMSRKLRFRPIFDVLVLSKAPPNRLPRAGKILPSRPRRISCIRNNLIPLQLRLSQEAGLSIILPTPHWESGWYLSSRPRRSTAKKAVVHSVSECLNIDLHFGCSQEY